MQHVGRSILVAVALVLVLVRGAGATFHFMSISELGAGFGGDPAVQFVELRLDSGGQTQLTNTRLTAFDADGTATELLLSNHAVSNGAAGANVLYATAAFAAATGVTPDFVIPAGVVTPTGMICWGAPGAAPPGPEPLGLRQAQQLRRLRRLRLASPRRHAHQLRYAVQPASRRRHAIADAHQGQRARAAATTPTSRSRRRTPATTPATAPISPPAAASSAATPTAAAPSPSPTACRRCARPPDSRVRARRRAATSTATARSP